LTQHPLATGVINHASGRLAILTDLGELVLVVPRQSLRGATRARTRHRVPSRISGVAGRAGR
jgi:hypothetical protein